MRFLQLFRHEKEKAALTGGVIINEIIFPVNVVGSF